MLYNSTDYLAYTGFTSSYYALVAELVGKKHKEKVTAGVFALGAFADLFGNPVGGRFTLYYSRYNSFTKHL